MLQEFLTLVRSDASTAARQLGLTREHAAIAARFGRVGPAWEPHLAACRETIMQAATRCHTHRLAFIIGAGDCRDVPVAALAGQFETTVLADVVIGPVARRLAARHAGRVICLPWDATGALGELAARRATISADEAEALFQNARPSPPPGGEPDLIVSANCLSQLGLIPSHSLPRAAQDDTFTTRCAVAAAQSHLRWLADRSGVRLLLGDVARLDMAENGVVLHREGLENHLPTRPPDRCWRWRLAPIPEMSRRFHRIHEVGAWIDAGADHEDQTSRKTMTGAD